MDPRAFLLICLATASRHQPSASLEVEAEVTTGPKPHVFNETDFQRLRDAVNSGDDSDRIGRMSRIAKAPMWPSFLKAHPEEGLDLFKKLAEDKDVWGIVRRGATESPAWPTLLQTHNAEAWQLFQKLAKDEVADVRKAAVGSPEWPMLLQTHNAEAWRLFQKLANDEWVNVREAAVVSPAWPMLLETHNAEAWQLFEKLATTDPDEVGLAATKSPAWPMLLETHHAEARRLFEKLATDDKDSVRKDAAMSSAWPDLVKSNLWESWQVLAELMSNREFVHHAGLAELAESPAWKGMEGLWQCTTDRCRRASEELHTRKPPGDGDVRSKGCRQWLSPQSQRPSCSERRGHHTAKVLQRDLVGRDGRAAAFCGQRRSACLTCTRRLDCVKKPI